MVAKYTSIKEIIAKIYRDMNLTEETLPWENIVEWSAEALSQIGAHSQYVEKSVELNVENHRASLPCDFEQLIQIEKGGVALKSLTGSFDNYWHNEGDSKTLSSTDGYGYTINSAFINTNFKEGRITLAYIGVPVDSDGFPLIPDDVSYKEAILSYVAMKMAYPSWMSGKQSNYRGLVQEWNHFCGQARGSANMPTIDEMEAIKKQWVRLMPAMNENKKFFNSLADKERIHGGN